MAEEISAVGRPEPAESPTWRVIGRAAVLVPLVGVVLTALLAVALSGLDLRYVRIEAAEVEQVKLETRLDRMEAADRADHKAMMDAILTLSTRRHR
jgi:ABC-type long-subunit fatty acid transport system fused permease/ATPase subunit